MGIEVALGQGVRGDDHVERGLLSRLELEAGEAHQPGRPVRSPATGVDLDDIGSRTRTRNS